MRTEEKTTGHSRIRHPGEGQTEVLTKAVQKHTAKTAGSTIVSVIVAFLLLLMMLAMFHQSIQLASRMVQRAVDSQKAFSELEADYYAGRTDLAQNARTPVSLLFSNGSESLTVTTTLSQYQAPSSSDSSIYYYGNGTSQAMSGGNE